MSLQMTNGREGRKGHFDSMTRKTSESWNCPTTGLFASEKIAVSHQAIQGEGN
jgi:hypothetical protein